MKTNFIYIIILLMTLGLYNCSDDNTVSESDALEKETPEPEDPAAVLSKERTAVIETLTGGNEKVWRISSAELINTSGTFDISTNFNVTDDEFIFSSAPLPNGKSEFEGSLEWRAANEIFYEAKTAQETLLDQYVSPEKYAFDFNTDSGTELISGNDTFTFTLTESNQIEGTIALGDGITMTLSLTQKLDADYRSAPSGLLMFTEAFTFQSNGIAGFAPGMVGSYSDNSMFLATRERAFTDGTINPERIIKFNLNDNTSTERLYFSSDFVSKQLHIINNQLKVIGGQRINTYDLALANEPTSSQDYQSLLGISSLGGLSRFGSAVQNDNIYIIGGDLSNTYSNTIFEFDVASESLTEIATIPEPRFGARTEIVNNKLYIFGGNTEFFTPPAKNTIYVFDIESGDIATETLPTALDITYTGKYENLIYVTGQVIEYDENSGQIGNEPFVGVYDTHTGVFTELETNLSSPELETIHSMAVFNSKLFVIYGQYSEVAEGELDTWSVLVADI